MLTFWNRSSRYVIVIVVLGAMFFLLAVWQVFFRRLELNYLYNLAVQATANKPHSSTGLRSSLTVNTFLNATHRQLVSPAGTFVLRLEPSGELRYLQVFGDGMEKSLFSTSTGESWPGEHQVDINSNGVLRVQVKATFLPQWKVTWTSSLLAHCKTTDSNNRSPVLLVADSGLLAIYPHRGSTTPSCVLHREVAHRSPRLAIVIAGFFRTNMGACKSHMKKIIQTWEQKHRTPVDVFVFTYVEDAYLPATVAVNNESILAALKACYQTNLKLARVRKIAEVGEVFSGAPTAEIKQCGAKLDRLQSQLKTFYLAGQLMRNYMLSEGITYDYVLRLRPDTDIWGTVPDLPILNAVDDPTRIFLPHPYREHYYWCSHHDGRIRTGVTDQLAYGTLPTMQTYLNMYLEFSDMVRTVTGHPSSSAKPAKYNTMACEGTVSDKGCDTPNTDPCAIECWTSYYLVLHGLEPEILWTWQQNVLRAGGAHSKTCGTPFNC